MDTDTVDFFKVYNKNDNTEKSTTNWMNVYKRWAVENGRELKLEILSKVDLNATLQLFFAKVTRKDGKNYEPSSLGNMQAAIDRYLLEQGATFSILKDVEFKGSHDVIEGRARFLREKLGMGRKPNRARSLNVLDEKDLWTSEQLGGRNARSLTNTMWFLFTQHFGLRGRQQHHTMKVEDFVINRDDENNEYVTFSEGVTKTRQGGTRQKQRNVVPKMFATGGERCPIQLYREFISRRPEELKTSGPFYLGYIDSPATDVWYKRSRLGVNSLDNIMKTMTSKTPSLAARNKRFTNHSALGTVINKMKKAKIPRTEIIGITGHTRTEGLDPYISGDEDEQRELSHVISHHIPPVSKSTTPSNYSESSITTSSGEPSYIKYVPSTSSHQTCTTVSSPMPPRNFNFFTEKEYERFSGKRNPTVMNFHNCDVKIFGSNSEEKQSMTVRKRRCVIESDSSSQES